uniref:RING-type domain-containing protein n=1 Tax=Chromera velia CCMP2878 TaxID=1169474 RepID=A0A0G4FH74_9ALVE|eukprot:Cvel_16968.t1-p1 / transcript=Cvel_16968.t1 / gene=Cvel_16968 / organism=Chromera_velia_CCMP2878 / gene_product=E3 ubiquitin-protein ligase RNF8, putative / transcript_product=E3 ubiquitin-protein ligase RNF8, putative / location=Cvel_scaffold1331:45417-46872(-) / protein_length=191 / sequence_SO=supercontig / SO=protein_coding / is_pseudo=false
MTALAVNLKDDRQIQKAIESLLQCAICQEGFNQGFVTLGCGHSFHSHCVDTWKKREKSCPLCKDSIKKQVQNRGAPRLIPTLRKAANDLARLRILKEMKKNERSSSDLTGSPTRDSGALPGNDTDSGPSVPPACVRALGDVKRFSEQVGSSALSVHFWTGASVRGPERFHHQLTHLGDKETGMLRKCIIIL